MIWIAVTIIYVIIWYKSTIYFAHRFNENHEKEYPFLGLSEGDKKFHVAGAMALSTIWFIAFPLFTLVDFISGRVPPTTKELQRQIENQHRQIKELEEMLGIEW